MDHVFSAENQRRIGSRLRSRLLIFLVGGIILLGILAYYVVTKTITWEVALIALAIGLIIGFVYGRLSRVRWHETNQQIVMQYDIITYVIIGAYLLLSYFRDVLLGDYLSGAALEAVSLAVIAGILIGRIFGLNIAIMKVLRAQQHSTPST